MQELNTVEVDAVSGGIVWIPIIIVVIALSGCDDNPAVNKEKKNEDKKRKAIDEQTG